VTIGTMLYFMYHDNILDEKMVDTDLLMVAHKYNIHGLTAFCVEYFKQHLSLENALDVLVSAHLINQKELFDAATKFAIENKGILVKTDAWKDMSKNNPKLASEIVMTMLNLE